MYRGHLSSCYSLIPLPGFAHTALVTTSGELIVWGRPHEIRKDLRLLYRGGWKGVVGALGSGGGGGMSKELMSWEKVDIEERCWRQEVLLAPRRMPLPSGEEAMMVSCGGGLTVVLGSSGRVYCMGLNDYGQCGIGKPTSNLWQFGDSVQGPLEVQQVRGRGRRRRIGGRERERERR